MEQDNEQPIEANRSRSVSRRRLLQLLAVSGGYAALDRLLPDAWITPAAAAGADSDMALAPADIPAGCTINAFPLRVRSTFVDNVSRVGNTTNWEIRFTYNDTVSLINASTGLTAVVNDNGAMHMIYNQAPIGKVGTLTPLVNFPYDAVCHNASPRVLGTVGNGTFSFVHNSQTLAFYTQAVAETPTVEWFLTDSELRQSNVQQTDLVPGPTAVDLADVNVEAVNDGLKSAAVAGAALLGAAAVAAMKHGKSEDKAA
jgi:hypothetical protein